MITNYLFLEYLDLEIFFNIINTKNILLFDNIKNWPISEKRWKLVQIRACKRILVRGYALKKKIIRAFDDTRVPARGMNCFLIVTLSGNVLWCKNT